MALPHMGKGFMATGRVRPGDGVGAKALSCLRRSLAARRRPPARTLTRRPLGRRPGHAIYLFDFSFSPFSPTFVFLPLPRRALHETLACLRPVLAQSWVRLGSAFDPARLHPVRPLRHLVLRHSHPQCPHHQDAARPFQPPASRRTTSPSAGGIAGGTAMLLDVTLPRSPST